MIQKLSKIYILFHYYLLTYFISSFISCSNSTCNIVSSWDVLNGQEVTGDCVVIGGGLVGAETAEYLANKGHQVTIVEMMDKIAAGESTAIIA